MLTINWIVFDMLLTLHIVRTGLSVNGEVTGIRFMHTATSLTLPQRPIGSGHFRNSAIMPGPPFLPMAMQQTQQAHSPNRCSYRSAHFLFAAMCLCVCLFFPKMCVCLFFPLKIVVEVNASGPPLLLKLWLGANEDMSPCEILSLQQILFLVSVIVLGHYGTYKVEVIVATLSFGLSPDLERWCQCGCFY